VPQRRFPINGEVDISSTEELQKSLLELVNTTNDDLVIDCDGLEFIDSTGVAVFMHIRQLLEIQNRGFRLENLRGMPRRTFDVLGLTDLLELPAAESA
jgi:anti-sigma B factor antagonist